MSSQISCKDNKNRIRKKLSFIEGGHQLEKLEFALAIAQTKGDEKKSIVLRKKIVEFCLLYTSPSPRDREKSRMPSSA